jgi:GNAT superfamily N-acetyltransferase
VDNVFIDWFFVDANPRIQHHGYGTKLMHTMIEYSISIGAQNVSVCSRRTPHAHEFYKKYGFHQESPNSNYFVLNIGR